MMLSLIFCFTRPDETKPPISRVVVYFKQRSPQINEGDTGKGVG